MPGYLDNMLWLVLCIYFESRSEPLEGQVAVAHVILNRVEKRNASVEDIVKAPYQFSWLNQGERKPIIDDFTALLKCLNAVHQCLAERLDGKDLSGADHYHTTEVHPYWADAYKKVTQIGNHIFYKS